MISPGAKQILNIDHAGTLVDIEVVFCVRATYHQFLINTLFRGRQHKFQLASAIGHLGGLLSGSASVQLLDAEEAQKIIPRIRSPESNPAADSRHSEVRMTSTRSSIILVLFFVAYCASVFGQTIYEVAIPSYINPSGAMGVTVVEYSAFTTVYADGVGPGGATTYVEVLVVSEDLQVPTTFGIVGTPSGTATPSTITAVDLPITYEFTFVESASGEGYTGTLLDVSPFIYEDACVFGADGFGTCFEALSQAQQTPQVQTYSVYSGALYPIFTIPTTTSAPSPSTTSAMSPSKTSRAEMQTRMGFLPLFGSVVGGVLLGFL
ncbi:hypothetical protein B0H11DRAFT_1912105 [Mycena galericulata]|nr:hypothetical protein B0H11DRAFT_1912105 [Mycena galericulata]